MTTIALKPRKVSKRHTLISWLSVYDQALAAERKMPRPNPATIQRHEQKYKETALELAALEMKAYRKKYNMA